MTTGEDGSPPPGPALPREDDSVTTTTEQPPKWAEAAERVRELAARLRTADADADAVRAERDKAMLEMRANEARPVDLAQAAGVTSAAIAKWLRRHESAGSGE